MDVLIGSKKFVLTKVNIKMRDIYRKISDLGADLTLLADEAESVADEEILADVNPGVPVGAKETAKARARVRKKLVDIDKRRRILSKEITDARDQLIEKVLQKNGYDYDREFWEEEADVEDINDIIAGLFRAAHSGK